jgi:tetratricopeptide (TPR) repeat protein
MKGALTAIGVLASLVLLAPRAEAQSGGARGTVVDGEGQPIAGASVRIEYLRKPQKYEVQTNDKGEYLQLGMEPGPHRITAFKEGYIPGAIDVGIMVGVTDLPRIELEAAPPPPLDQETLNKMFAEAVQLTQAGELDEAEAAYKEILELQPGLAEVLGNLGYVYAKKEDWGNAEATYLEALEQRPEESQFMMALAQVYRDSGQDDKAEELLERVASETTGDAAAQIDRGLYFLNSGRREEAQKAFEDALAADPSAAEAHYHLGTILVGQGKAGEALGHLEAYLAANPTNDQYVATAEGIIEALKP